MPASHPDPVPPGNPRLPAEALLTGDMTSAAARQIMTTEWSTVSTGRRKKMLIIGLRGEFDVTVRSTLAELLAPLAGTRPGRLVLDLADVSFMDCAAAAVLFEAVRRTLPHEKKPVIRAPRPQVLRFLTITGWDTHCAIDASPGPGESPGHGGQPGRGSADRQLHQLHELYERARVTRDQSRVLAAQLRVVQCQNAENLQRIDVAWDRAKQVRELWLTGRSADRLRYSATARLQARLASMPVIEQAKGIIMAQCRWPEDQAFDALRRASQRENIKLRDLAAKIVAQTTRSAPAQPKPGGPPATKPVHKAAHPTRSPVLAGATTHQQGRKTAG